MLLSHSSKKWGIDADTSCLGKAGKTFTTGIHLHFITWFSHQRWLITPVIVPDVDGLDSGIVENRPEGASSARENQSGLWTALGPVDFILKSCTLEVQRSTNRNLRQTRGAGQRPWSLLSSPLSLSPGGIVQPCCCATGVTHTCRAGNICGWLPGLH